MADVRAANRRGYAYLSGDRPTAALMPGECPDCGARHELDGSPPEWAPRCPENWAPRHQQRAERTAMKAWERYERLYDADDQEGTDLLYTEYQRRAADCQMFAAVVEGDPRRTVHPVG
jgi:hypothetical protein